MLFQDFTNFHLKRRPSPKNAPQLLYATLDYVESQSVP